MLQFSGVQVQVFQVNVSKPNQALTDPVSVAGCRRIVVSMSHKINSEITYVNLVHSINYLN